MAIANANIRMPVTIENPVIIYKLLERRKGSEVTEGTDEPSQEKHGVKGLTGLSYIYTN